jgi:hypothetical protein
MKAISCLFLACLAFFAVAVPQTASDPAKEFEAFANERSKVGSQAVKTKDYSSGIKAYKEIVDAYAKLAPELKKREVAVARNANYNLACYYSLSKDRGQAISFLRVAVDAGFRNYPLMKSDTDLDFIRGSSEYKDLLARVREVGDFELLLKRAGAYETEAGPHPAFTCQDQDNERLKAVRQQFNLDAVAGKGDDVSKVLRIMRWLHFSVNHDGSNMPSVPRNAIDLVGYAAKEKRGINCRCLAITLNECYLALGFKSRAVTCMPQDPDDQDCHVIVSVFVPSLDKWVWVDPSFNGYWKDEKGTLLSIEEVRERIAQDKPLVASPELDWNGTPYTADTYRNYMSKNLYWFTIALNSEANYETRAEGKKITFVHLLPSGFRPEKKRGVEEKGSYSTSLYTSDATNFWAKP